MRALSTCSVTTKTRWATKASRFSSARVDRRQVHLVEVHGRPVGRLPEILQGDVLHPDVDLLAAAGQEPLDQAGLLVGLDGGVGEAAVEKVERLGILLAHGRAHAAVVHRDELHEEVLQLGRLRRVGQAVVTDGGRMAHVIDPNDEGLDVAEGPLRVDVQPDEAHDDRRQARHGQLQIGVHHQGRAVLLDVPASGLAVFVASGWRNECGHERLPQDPRQGGLTRRSGKQRVGQRRHFQQAVRKGEQQEDQMEAADEQAVDGIGRRKGIQKVDEEAPEDEHEGLGDHLVEGVLEQGLEPAPEHPLQVRHQKERDEHGAHEHRHARGDEAEGDHGEEHHAGGGHRQRHEEIPDQRGHVQERRLLQREVQLVQSVAEPLDLGDLELAGQNRSAGPSGAG